MNLGQGFPDFGWPDEILDAAAKALTEGRTNMRRRAGLPPLREAIAAHYRRHFGQDLDADQVCVTSGATEALGAAILATIEPGDEVIIFTPAYDSYAPMIRRGGATPRRGCLQPPAWRIDRDGLEAAITPRTRAILFNNPHNPAGRLFASEELEIVAAGAGARPHRHQRRGVGACAARRSHFTPLATLPGWRSGRSRSARRARSSRSPGWKVGWMVAAPEWPTPPPAPTSS